MTLQVALLGTDGIVLASDKKVNMVNQNFNASALRSKILKSPERKILASWSGDQFPSLALAEYIVLNLNDLDLQFPYPRLKEASQEILNRRGPYGEEYYKAETIVITVGDGPKAYDVNATKTSCDCFMEDRIVKGHVANPACFFTERYYTELPIADLEPLAAHVVINAGRINPRGIEGLEIVRCTNHGFEFANDREISTLIRWSDKLDASIKRQLSRSPLIRQRSRQSPKRDR